MFPNLNEQIDLIRKGAIEIIPEDELVKKIEKSIKTNKPLNIKLGCDPSRPDLHLGHAVVLRKLRDFQDLGHKIILIVGDFTAMIGDPTGRSKTRPQLTFEETRINGQSYFDQASRILLESNLEMRFNSEWLSKMNFNEVIELASKYTVAQLLERDDFSKRYKEGAPISIHELMYPLAQAMDSFAIQSDVELGGTDQKFNLLVGREIQKAYNQEPQCILTMPILEGTDGVNKMSKSLDNYIAFTDTSRDMFGKAMSIPDELIARYYQYAANANFADVKAMADGLKDGTVHPRCAKAQVAKEIVKLYFDETIANEASDEFDRMFKKKDIPDDIEEMTLEISNEETIIDILVKCKLSSSKNEARQMIKQGGVYIDGERIEDMFAKYDFSDKKLIKYGKRKFLYITKS